MILKLSTWLVAVLAGGALLTGCGSSSTSTTTSTAAAPTPTATTTATKPVTTVHVTKAATPTTSAPTPTTHASTPTTSTSSANTETEAKPPGEQQIVTACTHRSASEEAALSPKLKAQLGKLCEAATSGNVAAQHKIAEEVCTELVKNSHIPAGAPMKRALAVCKTE